MWVYEHHWGTGNPSGAASPKDSEPPSPAVFSCQQFLHGDGAPRPFLTQLVSFAWAKFPCADMCVTWRNTWLMFVPTSEFIGMCQICCKDQKHAEALGFSHSHCVCTMINPLIIVFHCSRETSNVNRVFSRTSYYQFSVYKPLMKLPSFP